MYDARRYDKVDRGRNRGTLGEIRFEGVDERGEA